jgi:phage repressor protein C with HTH and peptisase S24 domain
MSTLGERIKYLRSVTLKLNQAAFAKKLGFSRSATISDYEKNKRNPDIATLRKIAVLGNVSLDWLLTDEGLVSSYEQVDPQDRGESGMPYNNLRGLIKIDVFDRNTAGYPEKFPVGDPVDIFFIPRRDYDKNIIALRHKGDCMSPNILDGATVGIDRSDRELVSGKIYAVWLGSEGTTFRRVYVYPERVVLKADNPTFPETDIPSDDKGRDFILGSVRWVFQRY